MNEPVIKASEQFKALTDAGVERIRMSVWNPNAYVKLRYDEEGFLLPWCNLMDPLGQRMLAEADGITIEEQVAIGKMGWFQIGYQSTTWERYEGEPSDLEELIK